MLEKYYRWLRFNIFYLGNPPWDTGVSPPELETFLDSADAGFTLDVGCGTGTNLLTMAKEGWEVVGMDIAWLSVLKARRKLRAAGVDGRVIHGDITGGFRLEVSFNLVLDIGCYHSLNQGQRAHYRKNLANWLVPGGTYLIYAHQRTSPDVSHGISQDDFSAFTKFLDLLWRVDNDEKRPDGGGGFPASWAQFIRLDSMKPTH